MMSHSRDRDSNSSYQAEVGLTFEHHFREWFRGRLGYRHANSTDGGPFQENRLLGRAYASAEVYFDTQYNQMSR